MITLTERAASQIRELHAKITEPESLLRVFVDDGGCDGCGNDYHYGMSFDEPKPEDVVAESAGLRVLIDPQSLALIQGSVIDFGEGPGAAPNFIIQNPNAQKTCGCGRSFS